MSNHIDRVDISEAVIQRIRELLREGDLHEGDRLPSELALCERLGVGRSSVREGLRMLEALGYIETRPGLGRYLVNADGQNVEQTFLAWFHTKQRAIVDLVDLRAAIEGKAAALAAERADATDIAAIAKAEQDFEQRVTAGDTTDVALGDEAFHYAILSASHNELLIKVYDLIRQPLLEYRKKAFSLPGRAAFAIEPHRLIAASILNHNTDAARAAVVGHIYASAAEVTELASALEAQGQPTSERNSVPASTLPQTWPSLDLPLSASKNNAHPRKSNT